MRKLILGFFLTTSASLLSQKQAEVSLELHDGNFIKGTASFNDIDLTTNYGKLVIPASKVTSIKVGYGKDKSAQEKANNYIKLLNSSNNDQTRKGSYDGLVKMGLKALSSLEYYLTEDNSVDSTYSGEYTIENAYEEIKINNNITQSMSEEDVINIDNMYSMGGTYNFTKLDVKTEYGTLVIPKEKIKSIDIFVISSTNNDETVFKLMANKNISSNPNGGWYKTGIMLKAGQKFSINANGEITLASLSNAVYKPNGVTKESGTGEFSESLDYPSEGYPTYGMLVYKIGENSYDNLKAGAKFRGVAKTSGMLYISIYETVFNAENKGFYTVRVSKSK